MIRRLPLLWLLAAPAANAQFALEDFALTACGRDEPLFRSGLEGDEAADVRPSGGHLGAATGAVDFSVTVPDSGRTHAMRLQVPAAYDAGRAWPLVVALAGAQASPANAAQQIRTLWQPTADLEGALVLVPIATGGSGGWAPAYDTPAIACALAEVERRYDVDRARRYLWGFSAGAHYGHALALANATRFAAYAVNAGALQAFACSPATCPLQLAAVPRRIPLQLRVGSSDTLAAYTEADWLRFQAAGWSAGVDLRKTGFVGAHTVGAGDVASAWGWFEGRRLPF